MTLVVLSILVSTGSASAQAAQAASCAERFPEADWTLLRDGVVSIETTGMTPGLDERFDRDISMVAGWISDDIGPFSATVCLVSGESAFDANLHEIGNSRLHAHSDLREGLFVMRVERFDLVAPAAGYTLAQHALWQNNEEQAFPEPLAGTIGHWYRARFLDRLEKFHKDSMFGNLFNTESIVDWTASTQEPIQNWDPQNNTESIGAFIDFAVTSHGTEVLLETDGDTWSEIEAEWRVALRNDLRGRDTDTTGWIGGVALTVVSLLVAVTALTLGYISKHRRRPRTETPPPIPGFFSES